MCLLVVAWQTHPEFGLVLAGNRDEFHDRPAAPADWWNDAPGVLAGRDLRAGGTWLGATRTGRFAVVTNYREPMEEGRGPRSRGDLVADYLRGTDTPGDYVATVARQGDEYGGFNLLVGDRQALGYVSNRGRGPQILGSGVYGLSNHLLDTPWPKLARVRARFGDLMATGPDPEELLAMLADRTPAPDEDLPRTGLDLQWERLLSPPFIESPLYGTRCTTVLRIARDGHADFTERRFDLRGSSSGESRFDFETQETAA